VTDEPRADPASSAQAEAAAPPYARLRDDIRRRIETGSLLPGDRLPTVRGSAELLRLAPNTVARAYRDLEADGWVVGRGRAGTFVADRPPDPAAGRNEQLAVAAEVFLRRAERLGFTHDEAVRALRRR
jgi:DNA-binding transcriptional regulator YhcF (GntR family)